MGLERREEQRRGLGGASFSVRFSSHAQERTHTNTPTLARTTEYLVQRGRQRACVGRGLGGSGAALS
jgi:hypothetical protein